MSRLPPCCAALWASRSNCASSWLGPGVLAAVVYGSWASGTRGPGSHIDVLVAGEAALRELRGLVRPIGKAAGRTTDLTVLTPDEFRGLLAERSSFVRRVLDAPTRR